MEELENYRIKLQDAFDRANIEEIVKVLKELKDMNVEIPFTVESLPDGSKNVHR
jgi:hypothetical protein